MGPYRQRGRYCIVLTFLWPQERGLHWGGVLVGILMEHNIQDHSEEGLSYGYKWIHQICQISWALHPFVASLISTTAISINNWSVSVDLMTHSCTCVKELGWIVLFLQVVISRQFATSNVLNSFLLTSWVGNQTFSKIGGCGVLRMLKIVRRWNQNGFAIKEISYMCFEKEYTTWFLTKLLVLWLLMRNLQREKNTFYCLHFKPCKSWNAVSVFSVGPIE